MQRISDLTKTSKAGLEKIRAFPNYKKKNFLALLVSLVITLMIYSPFIAVLIFLFIQYSPITPTYYGCLVITSILIYFAFIIIDLIYTKIIMCYFEEYQTSLKIEEEQQFHYRLKDSFIIGLINPVNIVFSIAFPFLIVVIRMFF